MPKRKKKYKIVDLFCGAGGTSTGILQAAADMGVDVELSAVNHWDIAIETHRLNHPEARHYCESIDVLNPRDLYRFGELDIMVGSPECIFHSPANQANEINEQSRATAWCINRWAEALQPDVILIENVPNFRNWGPLTKKRRPMKSKKGQTFRAWINSLKSLGYKVDYRVLNSADYGDPQARHRLFVQCVRGHRKITWPEQTHFPAGDSFGDLGLEGFQQHVSARDGVIDWDIESTSIFTREQDGKKPLVPNTIRRIEYGLMKFSFAPFLVPQQSGTQARSVDLPHQTITGRGSEYLATPFLIDVNHGVRKDTDHGRRAKSVDAPIGTLTGTNGKAVIQPFILRCGHGTKQTLSVDGPITTVTGQQEHCLVEPRLEPFQVILRNNAHARSIDLPVPTQTGSGAHSAVVEPFLLKFNGTGKANSVQKPIGTITTKDRFGLVQPLLEINGETYILDVHFRMLQPHELARAQGFPDGYEFAARPTRQGGKNKADITKQIGNAVPVNTARALIACHLK